jgi:hypothetical protein
MEEMVGRYGAIANPPGSVAVPPWNVEAEPVVTVTLTGQMAADGRMSSDIVAVVELVTATCDTEIEGPKSKIGSAPFPVGSLK